MDNNNNRKLVKKAKIHSIVPKLHIELWSEYQSQTYSKTDTEVLIWAISHQNLNLNSDLEQAWYIIMGKLSLD